MGIQATIPILLILGTIFGSVLNAVLFTLIRRRTRKRAGERVFFTLVVAGVIFNFALLCSVALQLLFRGKRLPIVCAGLESLSVLALAIIPSLLLHTFLAFYRPRWIGGWGAALLYVPALTAVQPVVTIIGRPLEDFLTNMAHSSLPFVLWAMVSALATAYISFALSGEAGREKESVFNETLGYVLLVLGVILALVALTSNLQAAVPVLGPLAVVATLLSPNVLAFIFAYSVYRYNYLGYFMKASLFHTVLASFALSIYFFGIRYIGDYLEQSYRIDFRVLEAGLVLGLLFAFNPVKQSVERLANRFFFQRFMHSRALLQNLSHEFNATALPNLPYLMDRVSITLEEVFGAEMAAVTLLAMEELAPALGNPGPSPLPQELVVWVKANPNKILDLYEVQTPEIAQVMQDHRISAVIPLAKDSELIGAVVLALREVESPLTPEERDLLLLLANQITMVLEKYQILEQKILLERKVLETEKLSSLGRLAASVAHEIKNPLSSIKAIVQTAREDVGGRGQLADDLSVVIEEIDRLNETVNRLLNFIKPELSPQKLAPVEGILEGVLDILRYEAQKRKANFVMDFAGEMHYVRGRAEDLKSIMFNLVLNGLEAMPDGGTLTVRTRSKKAEDPQAAARGRKFVVVEVQDTGVGIPPDRLNLIFEPFQSSKESGTGLGLAIVKQKIDELGGKIAVESNGGTRFTLELPVLGRA